MTKTGLNRIEVTGSTLKTIAIISMLFDHIGAAIVEPIAYMETNQALADRLNTVDFFLRLMGRLAFPIFCFLLTEGFLHTRNPRRYLIRLGIFAVISEAPFDLAFYKTIWYPGHQNVFLTLFLGLLTMMGIKFCKDRLTGASGRALQVRNKVAQLLILLAGCLLAGILRVDYGYFGVLILAVLYMAHSNRKEQAIYGVILFLSWLSMESFAALAFIPISWYNGKRGKQSKYFFYLFYPAHLLLLYGIYLLAA